MLQKWGCCKVQILHKCVKILKCNNPIKADGSHLLKGPFVFMEEMLLPL